MVSTPNPPPSDSDLEHLRPGASEFREFKVGLFVLLGLLSGVVALFLLTDPGTFRGRYALLTRVNDAGGIRSGDPVQMRGVNIGYVRTFDIDPAGEGVLIGMEIDGKWEVPMDSRVVLLSAGLMGGRIADIQPGTSPEMARPGTLLQGESVASLLDASDTLGEGAEDIVARIQELLDTTTVSGIQTTVQDLDTLLRDLDALARSEGEKLEALTDQLRSTARVIEANVEEAGPAATEALQTANDALVELGHATLALRRSTESIAELLRRLEAGEGTLGRLSADPALYDNLTSATANLDSLLADIRARPKRYINVSIF